MAQVPFVGLQDQPTAPGTIIPDRYQQISSSPDAFGAPQAQALRVVQGGLNDAAQATDAIQQRYDATVVQNSFSKLRDAVTANSWGDPSNPQAPPGLLTLQGEAAMRAYPDAVARLQQAQRDIAANLSPAQNRIFTMQAQRFIGDTTAQYDQHRAGAQQQWQVGSLDAQAASAQSAAIANVGNVDAFNHSLADARNAVVSKGSLLGWSSDAIGQELASRTSKTFMGAASRLADVNPQQGWSFYQQHQDQFTGEDRLAIESHLRPQMLQWGARDAENGLWAQYGGSGASYLSAAPSGSVAPVAPAQRSALLDQAVAGTMVPAGLLGAQVMQESRWDASAAGGGGSIGLGQILPSTASDPGFGMQGVDPASLRDPAANLRFTAQYLEARGKAAGLTTAADWQDPAKVATALRAYNGGGDPNYAANVLRYLPAGALGGAAHPSSPVAQAGVKPLAIGDDIAAGAAKANGFSGGGTAGADPDAVLDSINAMPLRSIPAGTPVVLSTGLSNDPAKIGVVEQQIASLHARGVTDIRLLGVGSRPDLAPLNAQLQQVAQKTGATFVGPLQTGQDGVHPQSYAGVGLPAGAAPTAPATAAPAPTQDSPTGAVQATGAAPPTASLPAAAVPGASTPAPPPAASSQPNVTAMLDAASKVRDPFGQDNPVFQEQVMSRIRARARLIEFGQQQAERANRSILLSAAIGLPTAAAGVPPPPPPANPGQTDPSALPATTAPAPTPLDHVDTTGAGLQRPAPARPTSLADLLSTPQLQQAWANANPEVQRSIMGIIEHNARGEDPPMTPAAQSLYYSLSGMAVNDRASFQKLNLADPQYTSALPHSYWNALTAEQNRFGNADVARAAREETQSRALTILKPDLLAAGFKVDGLKPGTAAAQTYDQFVGRLRESLDQFQQDNSRRPTDAEVAKLGSSLLLQGTQRGTAGILPWSHDTAVRAFQVDPSQFAPTVPANDRTAIVSAYAARHNGAQPTEGQVAEIWMVGRQQAMQTRRPGPTMPNRPGAAPTQAPAPAASAGSPAPAPAASAPAAAPPPQVQAQAQPTASGDPSVFAPAAY